MSSMRGRRGMIAVLAFGAVAALAGCGQKGPLYFPEDDPEEKRKRSSELRPGTEQADRGPLRA